MPHLNQPLQEILTRRFIALFFVPLILGGGGALFLIFTTTKTDVYRNNELLTISVADIIDAHLNQSFAVLNQLAATIPIEEESGAYHIPEILEKVLQTHPLFEGIQVIDSCGIVEYVGKTGLTPTALAAYKGIDLSQQPYFREVIQSKAPYWSDAFLSITSGHLSITMAMQAGNDIIAANMSLDALHKQTDNINLGEKIQTVILDRNGYILFHPDDRLVNQKTRFSPFGSLAKDTASVKSVDFTFQNKRLLGSYIQIAHTGWTVLVAQEFSHAYAPVIRAALLLLGCIGFVSLMALAAAMIISDRFSRLLKEISNTTRRIADGDYTVPLANHRIQEFDELTGSIAHMAGAITEREEMLRHAHDMAIRQFQFQQAFMNAIDMPIAYLSTDGALLESNNAFKTAFGLNDLGEQGTPATLIPDTLRTLLSTITATAFKTPQEMRIVFADKQEHIILVGRAPFHESDSRLSGFVCTMLDMTGRMELEQRLHHAEKLQTIGQLAGSIAHDFNNQLSGIMGYADILAETNQGNPTIHRYTGGILTAAERAAALVKQLLAFSRQGRYVVTRVNTADIVNEVTAMLTHTIDKRISIHCDTTSMPVIDADASQLQNAVLNLAVNARDAIPGTGTITLTTGEMTLQADTRFIDTTLPAGHYAAITVTDTGCGMESDLIKRIFEPFFTTKGEGKGTGMGLAAVYGTAHACGGAVDVTSTVGLGSTFRIIIPLSRGNDEPAASPPDTKEASTGALTRRILFVDDEHLLRRMTAEMLENAGHSVTTASGGKEAITLFNGRKDEIDLIILDMIMPDMDGASVFHEIRAINESVPVLLASGYSTDSRVQEVLSRPRTGFIQKPFRARELLEAIRTCCT